MLQGPRVKSNDKSRREWGGGGWGLWGYFENLSSGSCYLKSKSKPGRRVAGPFWAQAVNQKRQFLQIRIYKSLHFRQCRSCRKSQKVPTMLFCPVRIPSNARVACSDRRSCYLNQQIWFKQIMFPISSSRMQTLLWIPMLLCCSQ